MTRKAITVLIGEPCTGKSAIVRRLVAGWAFNEIKWTPHYHSPNGLTCVLGRDYEHAAQQFPGTDRLSMAVQPHALEFIENTHFRHYVIEGDRLGNRSFISALIMKGYRVRLLCTATDPKVLYARRRRERNQSQRFLKATKTKVDNIRREYPSILTAVPSNVAADIDRAVKLIMAPFTPIKIVGG